MSNDWAEGIVSDENRALRAEVQTLRERITADDMEKDMLRAEVERLQEELDYRGYYDERITTLEAWKAEAITVLDQWERVYEVASKIETPVLGESKAKVVLRALSTEKPASHE